MNRKRLLRTVSTVMLAAAVIFVFCALSNPALGHTVYIGGFEFGAEQWRVCYGVYVAVMAGSFAASFFVKEQKK